MLKTNRGFIKYFLLSIITLGIYGIYFIHIMAKDVNTTCEGDGRHSRGVLMYWLLTIITLGIYSIIWHYINCDRMAVYIRQNGNKPRITGGGWILWTIVGSFIIIGPIVAMVKEIHMLNDANSIYNMKRNEVN